MTKFNQFFIKPFTAKGFFWGCLDVLIKVCALVVWVYLVYILGMLVWQSIQLDYNRFTQLWWLSYCFLMFFGGTLLAYILLFVRDYNEEQ